MALESNGGAWGFDVRGGPHGTVAGVTPPQPDRDGSLEEHWVVRASVHVTGPISPGDADRTRRSHDAIAARLRALGLVDLGHPEWSVDEGALSLTSAWVGFAAGATGVAEILVQLLPIELRAKNRSAEDA